MKRRVGAVLCLLFGAALIWGGVSSASVAAGSVASTCTPNPSGGVANQCPTGTITFTETTTGPGTAPIQWTVTVSSSCGATMLTLHVPNNGSVTTTALPVYTNSSATTLCKYRFKETAAPRFTKSFSPASPASISFDGTATGSSLAVAISNVSSGSSSGPSTPSTPSTTPRSSSAAPSSTSRTRPSTTPASSGAIPTTIAQTGPSSSVGPTIIVGVGLCLLGGCVLLLARRRPSARQH